MLPKRHIFIGRRSRLLLQLQLQLLLLLLIIIISALCAMQSTRATTTSSSARAFSRARSACVTTRFIGKNFSSDLNKDNLSTTDSNNNNHSNRSRSRSRSRSSHSHSVVVAVGTTMFGTHIHETYWPKRITAGEAIALARELTTKTTLTRARGGTGTDNASNNYLPGFKDCPKNMKVAYQGEPGAYSEAAALTAYPDAEPMPCAVFEEAYEATEQFKSDRSVLPFENSLGGSIHKNYDLILTHDLHVVGEVNFKVNHCLMALPGTKKENLTRAMSHPQALAQCDDYLTKLGVIKESADDTAGSAKKIQENKLENVAAVASERAAMLYGMEILDSKIQDDSSNVTRFLALAREPLPPKEGVAYKTSIVFANKDGPGALFKALACFALRDINLTKIESRPLKTAPLAQGLQESMQFQYLFYVDFEASMAEERVQNALGNLQEQTSFLRVLGSYPKDVSKFE